MCMPCIYLASYLFYKCTIYTHASVSNSSFINPLNSLSWLLRLELSEVEVEIGKFSSLRQEVEEEERVFQVLKAQKAATRLQQEKGTSLKLQLKMQHLKE